MFCASTIYSYMLFHRAHEVKQVAAVFQKSHGNPMFLSVNIILSISKSITPNFYSHHLKGIMIWTPFLEYQIMVLFICQKRPGEGLKDGNKCTIRKWRPA